MASHSQDEQVRRISDITPVSFALADPRTRTLSDISADFAEIERVFSAPENVILLDDETLACAIFEHEGGGVYEMHFLCPGRGGGRLVALKKMLDTLFTTYGARGIYGYISRQNRAARAAARWLGGLFGEPYTDAAGRQLVLYSLTREQHARTEKGSG